MLMNFCLFWKNLNFIFQACVKYLSANKRNFLVSNEWNEFKSKNKDLAFRLLELLALIEEEKDEQVIEKQKGTKRPYMMSDDVSFPYQPIKLQSYTFT